MFSITVTSWVEYERFFSSRRQVKTDWRTQLNCFTLNGLMKSGPDTNISNKIVEESEKKRTHFSSWRLILKL